MLYQSDNSAGRYDSIGVLQLYISYDRCPKLTHPGYAWDGVQFLRHRRALPHRGAFRVDRTMVLDAGNKNEAYQFEPKTDEKDIRFIGQHGNRTQRDISQEHSFEVFEMKWSRLEKLSHSSDSDITEAALRLKTIIAKNPHKLLAGEMQLCRDLGIEMRENVVSLFYYPSSKRVSVQRHAETRSNDDAIRWAPMALPNDETKSTLVKNWLSTQKESDITRIRLQIDEELFEK